MTDIGPGDWVRLVTPIGARGRKAGFVNGGVYQVHAVLDVSCVCGERGGLVIERMPAPDGLMGWCVKNFAPIRPSGKTLLEEISRPVRFATTDFRKYLEVDIDDLPNGVPPDANS